MSDRGAGGFSGICIHWGCQKKTVTVGKWSIHFHEGNPINLHFPLIQYLGRAQCIYIYNIYIYVKNMHIIKSTSFSGYESIPYLPGITGSNFSLAFVSIFHRRFTCQGRVSYRVFNQRSQAMPRLVKVCTLIFSCIRYDDAGDTKRILHNFADFADLSTTARWGFHFFCCGWIWDC